MEKSKQNLGEKLPKCKEKVKKKVDKTLAKSEQNMGGDPTNSKARISKLRRTNTWQKLNKVLYDT